MENNIIQYINKKGLYRKNFIFKFLEKYYESNCIETLRMFVNTLNEYYKDNWTMNFISKDVLEIYIIYPELTIVNMIGQEHNTKDFVFRFDLLLYKDGYSKVANFKCGKFSMSYSEYVSSYVHSHCRASDQLNSFNEVCLGSESQLEELKNIIEESPISTTNYKYFSTLLS